MSAVLRSKFSNIDVAKRFGAFCKEHAIMTRGFVKVGMTPRGIRGVVAVKPIPVNENVIIVPHKAFITAFDAARNQDFVKHVCGGTFPVTPDTILERLGGSFLYVHQAMLGYYLADILLLGDHMDATAQSEAVVPSTPKDQLKAQMTPGGGFNRYVDFMPRSEANFTELRDIVRRTLKAWPLNEDLEANMSRRHHLSVTDVREVVEWAIFMSISRGLPIEHKPTLEKIMDGTDFTQLLAKEPEQTQYSIPVMTPLLDMVNHSTQNENVAVMIPDHPMRDTRPIVARSMRPIAAGEEILMRYAVPDPYAMRVFYGMQDILP
jgi:hypothetical protein